jgi:leukotriene A-4 hydrolase/aminopeptidase
MLGAIGCQKQSEELSSSPAANDPHSFSRPDQVEVTHLLLDLTVDFTTRQIAGKASLNIENKTGSSQLILDTRDLQIERVTLGGSESTTTFILGEPQPYLGQPLTIEISPETMVVHVYYSTSPNAGALQWLTPEQTLGKQHPFLFTQSQAILARTWVPCQDSPSVRMSYSAKIKTDPELLAVMSAENPREKSADGVYTFEMPQPIPSYLLALAIGDLAFREMGPRTGVYAEPLIVEKAAWEFSDTEKMMDAAEGLYGPYRWGRYDLIILPPSFPFGGMENPRLTFLTPTVLAGDRSLVALVAHELAHSWSGNLVTNANWNDFWLNEGFTTYIENRIMEEVYGKEYADMLAVLSFQNWEAEIENLGPSHPDTHLLLNLAGRDPDEGMTDIAYDKGFYFLKTLEHTFGREKWDEFLRDYFDKFAFQTMTSEQFVEYLQKELLAANPGVPDKLQIKTWIYDSVVPSNVARVQSDAFAKVETQLRAWLEGKPAASLDTMYWTTHHWLHFLRTLPESLDEQKMAELDAKFGFTQSGNSEILFEWLQIAIRNDYQPAYPSLENFLTGMGRRKFLEPLYEELAKTPTGREFAESIYAKARASYHPLSAATIDEVLN